MIVATYEDLADLVDDLAFTQNIFTREEKVEKVLQMLFTH